jgi:hypothetical protein
MISSKEPCSPIFAPRLLYIYRANELDEEKKKKREKKKKEKEKEENQVNEDIKSKEVRIRHIGGNICCKSPLIYDANNKIIGANIEKMNEEMLVQSKLHLGRGKMFCSHYILSLTESEKLNDLTWLDIATEYMEKMGYDETTVWTSALHQDTDNEHLHIVACRVKDDGSLVNDKNDYEKSCNAVRDIEKKFGLVKCENFDKTFTKEENNFIADERRMKGYVDHAKTIRAKIKSLYDEKKPSTMTEFVTGLKKHGVYVTIVADDNKPVGIKYSIDNEKWLSGSNIKKTRFTWANLKKVEEISYEPWRDNYALGLKPVKREKVADPTVVTLMLPAVDSQIYRMTKGGNENRVFIKTNDYKEQKYIEIQFVMRGFAKSKSKAKDCEVENNNSNILTAILKMILTIIAALFGKKLPVVCFEGEVDTNEYKPVLDTATSREVKPVDVPSLGSVEEYKKFFHNNIPKLTAFMKNKNAPLEDEMEFKM